MQQRELRTSLMTIAAKLRRQPAPRSPFARLGERRN